MNARSMGGLLIGLALAAAIGAPVIAPHAVDARFAGLLDSPPTRPHVVDGGSLHRPFINRWALANQLEQRYDLDPDARVPLVWLRGGRLVQSADDARAPLLLLGTDAYGRDVFSRLVYGARISLALSVTATVGALLLGALAGAVAAYAGGAVDEVLTRASDFLVVLPAMYVALALRAVMPAVLSGAAIFLLLAAIFAIVGAPFVARGVRAIVRAELALDYTAAARSLGAGHARLVLRHLLPAASGFTAVQATVLVPAFIVAEATLSFVGLGFPDPIASWGTMLHDAASIRAFADFPWLLSPALAIFLLVLGLNLVLQQPAVAYNQPDESARRLRPHPDTV
jgi:peptide/nickel transport system permease protein